MKTLNLLGVALAVALGATPALAGPTLDKIKAAGVVTCGVSTGLAGFSMSDQQGNYTGLDVDTCVSQSPNNVAGDVRTKVRRENQCTRLRENLGGAAAGDGEAEDDDALPLDTEPVKARTQPAPPAPRKCI